jgi:putative aldouronate transport system substrate-binding protein
MRMKKYFSFLMVAVFLASTILAGCGSNTGNAPANNEAAPNVASEESSEEVSPAVDGEASAESFSYLMHDKFINWLNELKWYPQLLENTGVNVELVSGGSNDDEYYAGVEQRIISKTFPDSGIVSVAQAKVYGTQGAFVDLKPYIEEYGPNIQAYIDAHPDFQKLITTEDGAIYGLVAEAPIFADFIFYRQDHFEKAGVTTVPQTIDELTDAMRQLKAFYGADNPNYYPMTGREAFIRFQSAFNATANYDDGVSNGVYGNGKTGTDIYSDGYKEMIEWYKLLYDEGLIDPEWVAGASTEEAWESKMLTGQGSLSYDYLTRPSWFMENGGPDNDPDYNIAIMPYLLDNNGEQSIQPTEVQYNILRAMVVNIESEDKAPTIIKFLDYLYSDGGQTLVSWGVEGESFETVDGVNQFIVDFSTEEATPAGELRWSFLNDRLTFVKPLDDVAFFQWNTDLVKNAAAELYTDEYIKPGTLVIYTAEQSADIANLSAAVNDAVNAGVTKFVTGERDMGEWDAFLGEMETLGYKDIVSIQQEAYDAMYK